MEWIRQNRIEGIADWVLLIFVSLPLALSLLPQSFEDPALGLALIPLWPLLVLIPPILLLFFSLSVSIKIAKYSGTYWPRLNSEYLIEILRLTQLVALLYFFCQMSLDAPILSTAGIIFLIGLVFICIRLLRHPF